MNILFVCTGNTCRSPMAAALSEIMLNKKGIKCQTDSAGMSVFYPSGASGHAINAMREYGINISGHKSKQVSLSEIEWADLILTMTETHKSYLTLQYVDSQEKIFTLSEYAGEENCDVSDPFGGSLQEYKSCAKQLERLLEKIIRSCSQ